MITNIVCIGLCRLIDTPWVPPLGSPNGSVVEPSSCMKSGGQVDDIMDMFQLLLVEEVVSAVQLICIFGPQ